MNKLDCLIQELCPNGIEYLPLEKCCTILDNKRKPVTKAAREAGEYPYYGANGIQDYVSDYIFNGTFVLVGEDGSVITSSGTPVVTWATGKIWVNNHAHIISEIDGVLLRYLFHYLQTVNVTPLIHGNIPKLTGGDFRAIRVPIPPLAVQQEIVRILDGFTELTTELNEKLASELTARRKQYEHYRDELLMFGEDVQRRKLVDSCDICRGIRVVRKQLSNSGRYPVFQNSLSPLGFYEKANCRANTTFIITAGAAGSLGYSSTEFWAADDCYFFECARDVILNKFLFYALDSQQERILGMVRKASIPRLGRSSIENLSIPIPPLPVQERIVSILDSFSAICNNLIFGLPAEIAARQRQYEYYRDKLLAFKELGA